MKNCWQRHVYQTGTNHVHALDCVGCPRDDTWVAILSLLGVFFSFLLGTPWETGNQYSAMGHLL